MQPTGLVSDLDGLETATGERTWQQAASSPSTSTICSNLDSRSEPCTEVFFAQRLHSLSLEPCMYHTGAAPGGQADAAARRGRSLVGIPARWQSIGGKGGDQAAKRFSSPDSILRCQVSIAHHFTQPDSLFARHTPHKLPCHSKSKRHWALCLQCIYAAMPTQWHYNVNTLTTHSTACMHSCLQSCNQSSPADFSKNLPLHMTHPGQYEHLDASTCSEAQKGLYLLVFNDPKCCRLQIAPSSQWAALSSHSHSLSQAICC